jgi:hypothetical protein
MGVFTAVASGASRVTPLGRVTWTEDDTDPLSARLLRRSSSGSDTKATHDDPTTSTGDGCRPIWRDVSQRDFRRTGATRNATGTYHFVASHHGQRIDSVSPPPQ